MKTTVFLLSILGIANSLDLVFDSISCDESLPAFASENGITMTCQGKERCTLGDNAMIMGTLNYYGLQNWNLGNNTGYVSANLQLMHLEYELFEFLPFNFCGEWLVDGDQEDGVDCPADGQYAFSVPYTLPERDDMTTWFATGWEGASYLKIYKSQGYQSSMLANCKVHFKTFVTGSEEENWYSMPSAAETTLALFAVLGALFSLILCMACRPKAKHPTDEDYEMDFSSMDDRHDPIMSSRTNDDEESPAASKSRKLSLSMKYNQRR